jgi:hypothetical protein
MGKCGLFGSGGGLERLSYVLGGTVPPANHPFTLSLYDDGLLLSGKLLLLPSFALSAASSLLFFSVSSRSTLSLH